MSGTTMRVVLALLVISFASWGLHGLAGKDANVVIDANGVQIKKEELSRLLKLTIDSSSPAMQDAIKTSRELKNKTLETLARNLLLKKIIIKNLINIGIAPSKAMLSDEIASIEKQFGSVEQFSQSYSFNDKQLYSELEHNSIFNQLALSLDLISPSWPTLRGINNSSINVSKIVSIKKIPEPKISVTKKELQEFYTHNIKKYQTKPSATVTEYRALETKIDTSSDNLLKFYNNHIDWYIKPAYIVASIYDTTPGNLTNFDFLTKDQQQELRKNKLNLVKKSERRFIENTTEPGLYAQLNSLAKNEADYVLIDGKEVMVAVTDKQEGQTPEFSEIEKKVKQDVIKTEKQVQLTKTKAALISIEQTNQMPDSTTSKIIDVTDLDIYGKDLDRTWLTSKDNEGKYKLIEKDNVLILVKLSKVHAATAITFDKAAKQVEADLKNTKKMQMLMESAKNARSQIKFEGKEHKINLSIKDLQIPTDKLMQLQFYPEASSLIYQDNNSVYVARLIKVLPDKLIAPTKLEQVIGSYKVDSNRIFSAALLN